MSNLKVSIEYTDNIRESDILEVLDEKNEKRKGQMVKERVVMTKDRDLFLIRTFYDIEKDEDGEEELKEVKKETAFIDVEKNGRRFKFPSMLSVDQIKRSQEFHDIKWKAHNDHSSF